MAVSFLKSYALVAQVPVFVAIGPYMRDAVEDLFRDQQLVRANSIRHASILLVAGSLRDSDGEDIRRLHDQMPHPRATIWWNADPDDGLANPLIVDGKTDPKPIMIATFQDLIDARRASEADLLPDEPPNSWQGEGDYGQGGKGMMGGNPYGRRMAMTDDDLRDGLALDAYTAPFGPFLPILPPGLQLSLTLQGDVIQLAKVIRSPFAQIDNAAPNVDVLRQLARFLRVLGLEPHADRCMELARDACMGKPIDVAPLRKLLRWSGARFAVPPGLGRNGDTDVRSRFETWLDVADAGAHVETAPPRGPSEVATHRLVDLLKGLEWNEAVLVVNSFDSKTLIAMSPVEDDDGGAHEGDGHTSHSANNEHDHSMHGDGASSQ